MRAEQAEGRGQGHVPLHGLRGRWREGLGRRHVGRGVRRGGSREPRPAVEPGSFLGVCVPAGEFSHMDEGHFYLGSLVRGQGAAK